MLGAVTQGGGIVPLMGRPADDERARLGRVFSGYREDPDRRRVWSAGNPGNAAIREELARAALGVLAQRDVGGLLLDAGCGTGWWLERLLVAGVPGSRLVGVELLPERARAAAARAPGVDVRCADIRELPVGSGSCALVTLFTTLSGMGSAAAVQTALAQSRRVIAPGGAIVIWEPRVVTRNPDTRLISKREFRAGLGPELDIRSISLAPPIARRAGASYRALAALPALRSHRLVVARPKPG
jgi:SAM-dependent methyltransferase